MQNLTTCSVTNAFGAFVNFLLKYFLVFYLDLKLPQTILNRTLSEFLSGGQLNLDDDDHL